MIVLFGVAFLIGAGVLGFLVYRAWAQQKAMLLTETLSADELGQLRDAATEAAGPGTFRQRTEVVGAAVPGPGGALKAEISGQRCVWHRHVITRKYWEERRDSNGRYRRDTREEKIGEGGSDEPFYVRDETGKVLVHPSDKIDGLRPAFSKFEKANERRGTKVEIGRFKMTLPSNQRGGTLGYRYEEWALPPKRRVFVLGEARDQGDALVVSEPVEGGDFVISVKSEEELMAASRQRQQLFGIGAIACVVIGMGIIVYQLFFS